MTTEFASMPTLLKAALGQQGLMMTHTTHVANIAIGELVLRCIIKEPPNKCRCQLNLPTRMKRIDFCNALVNGSDHGSVDPPALQ